MKVLLVSDKYSVGGGSQQVVFNQEKLLKENCNQVSIFYLKKRFEIRPRFMWSYFNIIEMIKFKKKLKQFKPDIIHLHCFPNITPSILPIANFYKIPIVMTIHDPSLVCPKEWAVYQNGKICNSFCSWKCLIANCETPHKGYIFTPFYINQFLRLNFQRLLIKKYVDKYILLSYQFKDIYSKSLKLKEEDIEFIPNFVFKDFKFEEERQGNLFIYVGRVSVEKGINILINAIDLLVNQYNLKDIKIKIIGKGKYNYINNLKKEIKEKGIENNINFIGNIDNNKLYKEYQRCCAVIIPSNWLENCPLVCLESMANKTPVIGSNVGGLKDMIKNNNTGFIFNMGDYKELANCIKSLYNNKNLLRKLSNNAEIRFNKFYNKDIHYNKLINLYNELIIQFKK